MVRSLSRRLLLSSDILELRSLIFSLSELFSDSARIWAFSHSWMRPHRSEGLATTYSSWSQGGRLRRGAGWRGSRGEGYGAGEGVDRGSQGLHCGKRGRGPQRRATGQTDVTRTTGLLTITTITNTITTTTKTTITTATPTATDPFSSGDVAHVGLRSVAS